MNLKVLYEDNHIIVVLKPSGVLSQAGSIKQPDMVNLLKDYLKKKYNKPGNVYLGLLHRLDINVSGLMVFARTSKAAKRISEDIRNHDFVKRYFAIAYGNFIRKEGKIEDYILKDESNRQAILANNKTGKLAVLKYRVIDERKIDNDNHSLLDIELITGRFHQIRFQLANLNHPLYGDGKYGKAIKKKEFFLGLYAYQIEFNHPVSKERMIFNLKPTNKYFNIFDCTGFINWRKN